MLRSSSQITGHACKQNFSREIVKGEYYLPLDCGEHIEGTMIIIKQVIVKVNSVESSISISTE